MLEGNFITSGNDDLIYADSDVKFNNDRNFIRSFLLAKSLNNAILQKMIKFSYWMSYRILSCNLSNLVGYVFAIENDKKTVELANKNLYELNLLNCSVNYKSRLNHVI